MGSDPFEGWFGDVKFLGADLARRRRRSRARVLFDSREGVLDDEEVALERAAQSTQLPRAVVVKLTQQAE